jgi:hypothetical protein
MAKVKRIPLGLEPGQQRIELPDRVSVELASLAPTVKEGLLAFAVGVGMQVFRTMLEEDVASVAGPKGRHDPTGRVAYRHGDQESSVVLGGRKVAVSRPRVRGVAGGELSLPIWEAFAGEELLGNQVMTSLAGVSTRNYDKTLEPVGALDASATSRSAVSRRFVARTAKALDELMAKDLSDLRICALFVDGIEESDHMMLCAIGLDTQGRKHPLGLREGTTENKAVCAGLLSDLVGRGLDFSGGILAVLDGGKGLRAAVREVFGSLGVVQRCRAHKRRNVLVVGPFRVAIAGGSPARLRPTCRPEYGQAALEGHLAALGVCGQGRGVLDRSIVFAGGRAQAVMRTARSAVSAPVNWASQGQACGRCSLTRRPDRASRPGTDTSSARPERSARMSQISGLPAWMWVQFKKPPASVHGVGRVRLAPGPA